MGNVILTAISGFFFEYDTPRIAHIRSKKVGLTNRFIQIAIISYIIGFVIVYKKGYQETDSVQSAVTTKVKGIVFSNYSHIPSIGMRTWDVADYVIPPQESNAFFVMTNVIPTPMQSQKACPEDPRIKGIQCEDDAYCETLKGITHMKGSGPVTGRCVESDFPRFNGTKVCEIYGWCPVENDGLLENLTQPVLQDSRNFTVFIKNNIEFPKFGVARRNLLGTYKNDSELSSCRWSRNHPKDRFCPIFVLDDICRDAGVDYEDMTYQGGVMQIIIDWTCNLDNSVDECVPSYTFRRLDKGDFKISKGFNFRYADQFGVLNPDGSYTLYRNSFKAYGVRFLVTVQGKAGKFSIVPLLLNIGSGLGLLSVATIICDIVVLYFLKARHFYRDKKYLDVKGADAFEILEESDAHMDNSQEVTRRNVTNSQEGGASRAKI